MKVFRRFFSRLFSRAKIRQDEARLHAEIEHHLALQTAENIRLGMPPQEARRQAVLKFGALQALKESYRDERRLPLLETLMQDTRLALRRLSKAPAFTLTVILTLALGIGANTSIFTLVHAVLLKSLAVANPAELYRLGKQVHCCEWGGYSQGNEFSLVSYDLYKHFRDNAPGFASLAAFEAAQSLFGVRRVARAEPALSYPGEFVSGNYFDMFGVKAFAGRALTPHDDQPGAPPVAVMSYRLWQQKYSRDPSILGSAFNINGKTFIIVGIAPPSFFGDTLRNPPPDFFFPLGTEPLVQAENSLLLHPDSHWLELIGRVQPGVSASSLQAQMRIELKQWLRSHWGDMAPDERTDFPAQTLYLSPGGAGITFMRDQYQHWLQILMLFSAFVLLIVCANIANLMLVRGVERRQQTSLSLALGARVSSLVRQALTESILLSLAGGLAGLMLASAGTRLILHFAFPPLGAFASVPISPSPSAPVLLFAFAVSLLTGVAFGIAPAWIAARVDPIEALRGANRSTGRTNSLPRQTLVVLQVALSLVLLSASGLLTAALRHLVDQDFGFDQNRRTIVNIDPLLAGYRADQLSSLYRRLRASLSAIPGVSAVALCSYAPQSGNSWNDAIYVAGRRFRSHDNLSSLERVTAGYFDAIGTPVLQGRGITELDSASSRHVVVINQAFARKFFPNENPLGKHFGRSDASNSQRYEVVGVVKDARYLTFDLEKPVGAFFFLPESQFDVFPKPEDTRGDLHSHFLEDIVVVTHPGASLSNTQLRRALSSVDPNLPINFIRPLSEQVADQFSQQRLLAHLSSFFGLLSLVLATIGLYGVTAYSAGRRTNEIGVRMALGANRSQVITLLLRGACALIFVGLLIGLPLTFAAGRVLGSQLYGINPDNAAVAIVSIAALGLSALLASLVPALRASSISPLEALRVE